ncbi:hypothetical protein M9H77_35488 [Catharanthus roseus]|uniref:Uncharacterized protein n=1 Tax=Catharanthus roseus TaxID=4058 RepID=A0ACB9ZPW2_CATRO|nr:hypothetical protein M9H77_35488 [Catharanthus roseus]
MAIPNAKSPLVPGLDMASMLCSLVCVIIPLKFDPVQVQRSHESMRRQLATVKGCAPYSAKRVGLNIHNRLRPQCRIRSSSVFEPVNALRIHAFKAPPTYGELYCSTGIGSIQNACTEDQYNTSRGPHSKSNQIGAHPVSIKHQGQWAPDARALALLPSTLFIG